MSRSNAIFEPPSAYSIQDEAYKWFNVVSASTSTSNGDIETDEAVEVRVTFNRDLTWSERETFRQWTFENELLFVFDKPSVVFVADPLLLTEDDTRTLYEMIATFVATEFVNVHPRAVKTISPEVTV